MPIWLVALSDAPGDTTAPGLAPLLAPLAVGHQPCFDFGNPPGGKKASWGTTRQGVKKPAGGKLQPARIGNFNPPGFKIQVYLSKTD